MAKSRGQKIAILLILRILWEESDEEHPFSISQLSSYLKQYGIELGRDPIRDNIECLRTVGFDIVMKTGAQNKQLFFIADRSFELAELKVLVDAVQASRFVTEKKSEVLIRKISGMTNTYEAKQLQRQVFVSGRPKSTNEKIYYNVDVIHTAISENKQISFSYFQWNVEGEKVLRHYGRLYEVSPWAVCFDRENYYMIAYDIQENMIKHYRVDKMQGATLIDQARIGQELFAEYDIASYTKRLFGMFDGEEIEVKLKCRNDMAGIIIDRFGLDCMRRRVDEDHFLLTAKVALSDQLIGWIVALGDGVEVIAPEKLIEKIRGLIQGLSKTYLRGGDE